MDPIHYSCIETPVGFLRIKANESNILEVCFIDEKYAENENEISNTCKKQLQEYLQKERTSFDLPLKFEGTVFQITVWQELKNIPYGKTISYQRLAELLGDRQSIRAAASANGKNSFAIIIPCHRVIGSDGSLTGYAGGLHRKQWLLEHEGSLTQKALNLF